MDRIFKSARESGSLNLSNRSLRSKSLAPPSDSDPSDLDPIRSQQLSTSRFDKWPIQLLGGSRTAFWLCVCKQCCCNWCCCPLFSSSELAQKRVKQYDRFYSLPEHRHVRVKCRIRLSLNVPNCSAQLVHLVLSLTVLVPVPFPPHSSGTYPRRCTTTWTQAARMRNGGR